MKTRPTAFDRRRRRLLAAVAAAGVTPWAIAQGRAPMVTVWKSPTCGCCKDWIAHMQASGFRVQVHETGNNAARARLKVPVALGSCHTAQVDGYALEGHVPAVDVRRLLAQRPRAVGLAVPGMPVGAPGMDGPEYGGRRDPYDVLLIAMDGSTSVFARHR